MEEQNHKIHLRLDKVKNSEKYYWVLNVDGDYSQSKYFDTPKNYEEFANTLVNFIFEQLPKKVKLIVQKEINIDTEINKHLYLLENK